MDKEAASAPWKSVLWGVARLLGTGTFTALNAQGVVDEYHRTKEAYREGNKNSVLGHGLLLGAQAALVPSLSMSTLKNALVLKAYPKSHALVEEAKNLGNVFNGKSLQEAVQEAKVNGLKAPDRFTHTTGYLQGLAEKGQLPRKLTPAMKELDESLNDYHIVDALGDEAYKALTPGFIQNAMALKRKLLHKVPYVGSTLDHYSIAAPLLVGEQLVSDDTKPLQDV